MHSISDDAAQDLRHQKFVEIPVGGELCHAPGAGSESDEADHHHQARVHLPRQEAGDRRGEEHCQAADEQRFADHQRIVAANTPEKERIEIGEPVEADAHHEGKHRAEGEIDIVEGAQVDDRLLPREGAPEEHDGADDQHDGEEEHRLVLQPVIVRPFLQDEFERAEEGRHAGQPHQSNFLRRPGSGLSKSISDQAAVATKMPGMTLIRNSQCQDMAWLM